MVDRLTYSGGNFKTSTLRHIKTDSDEPPIVKYNQSINLFVQKCNTHWTGHQGRMQPPLTGARRNNVSKSNK